MITYRNRQIEDYFIDKNTAVITDKLGNVQDVCIRNGRRYFKSMPIYAIMMHTYKGFKEGLDIHHKDRNKLNDELENLIYLEHKDHVKMHHNAYGCEHLSDSQKKKLHDAAEGHHWYNDGREELHCRECPIGFVRGRLKK